MQYQTMVRMQLKIGRDIILNGPLHMIHCLARRYSSAIANPVNMRIHGLGRLAPPHVQYNICRLTANPWEAL